MMEITRRKINNVVDYGYYQDDSFINHREGGPAVVSIGVRKWYLHGVLHREDGPAFESDRYKAWWIDGDNVEESKFEEAVRIYKISKLCK
jgi:hypothetical protein